jgi:hypothetical protein
MKNNPNPRKVGPAKSKTKALGLYPDGSQRQGKTRPRIVIATDTPKLQPSYTRYQQLSIARQLFAQSPVLGGAILSKAEWCAGPGSFTPLYVGESNSKWGDLAETWLMERYLPVCSVLGANQPFTKILELSSVALDVDGDTGLVLTKSTDGSPKVLLVPAHRIGDRESLTYFNNNTQQDNLVKTGPYKGKRIVDGVILAESGTPIAYRVLGSTEDKDVDLNISAINVLMDMEWADQLRGISKIIRSRYDWEDQDDIHEFIKRGLKFASSIGVKYKSASGTAEGTGMDPASYVGLIESTTKVPVDNIGITPILGGEGYMLNSTLGEDLETLKLENPSPNTDAFLQRLQAAAMFSIGWPIELLDCSRGGASVRLLQDLVRKTIQKRQSVLERRARTIILYGLATAISNGELPPNNEWTQWTFTRGNVLTVDGGNEAKADLENLKMGLDNYTNICAKKGLDFYQVLQQTKREGEELIAAADQMAKKTGKPFDFCFSLLRQSTPNGNTQSSELVNKEKI